MLPDQVSSQTRYTARQEAYVCISHVEAYVCISHVELLSKMILCCTCSCNVAVVLIFFRKTTQCPGPREKK